MAEEVRAKLDAVVVRIVAPEETAVELGDTLVILDALSTRFSVLTGVSGTVTKVAVAEGAFVNEGDLIAVVS
jgi:biotin carboxyl carrier protein